MARKPTFRLRLYIAIIPFFFASPTLSDRVIYVDQSATGANGGTSWADAYLDLQDALDDAQNNGNCPCEIWITAGTYKPDRGTGDQYATFQLFNNLSLYGGFAGREDCPDERDIAFNPTVLEGDLLENDEFDISLSCDCCVTCFPYHCSNSACVQAVAALGGSYSACANGWDFNCVEGAGIACGELCRPTRSDNTIKLVNIHDAENIIIDGFTFARADAFCYEAAEDCDQPSALSIRDSQVVLRNCRFLENRSVGTAALYSRSTMLTAERCTFENNLADLASAPTYSLGNAVRSAGNSQGITSSFSNCEFRNNADFGFATDGDVRIEDCRFVANKGGLSISGPGQPVVLNCTFLDHFGMSVALTTGAPTTIGNCLFLGNHRGITINNIAVIANTIVAGGSGTGIYAYGASLTLLNSVVSGNASRGVVISSAHIANSIIRGNTHSTIEGEHAQIDSTGAPPTLLYNSIEGWTGSMGGTGNVDVEPLFADIDGLDDILYTQDDNFHLASDSPLINFGHPDPPLAPYLDGDGRARILCDRIDIGAYEFGIGDYNCDRVVELADFANFSTCLTGPAPTQSYMPPCAAYDFATEVAEDVDLLDFAGLQNDR